ncbi:hypothetical protein [Rhabdaerophilum sp. SD176]|uniref:hypothetical protein n=1 Tax=Rhabdaerophilum sp. SD176 TaxID=2983548 RepID=UPI0024DF959C|nr:hypothetical protein [Rhabdaerophilum sp. SD176]
MTLNPFAPRPSAPAGFHASEVFLAPNLEKAALPGPETSMVDYTIYCAGAPHLAQFSRLTGIPVFKIGIARFGAINRIRGLARHHYAGYWGRPGEDVSSMTALPGAESWVQIRLPRPSELDHDVINALRFENAGITISLPASIHPETVDRTVDDLLANINLRRVLATEGGQVRLRNGGVDQKGWFFTHYQNADRPDQLAEARELYVFEPRQHTGNLARGLARLVHHYGACRDE